MVRDEQEKRQQVTKGVATRPGKLSVRPSGKSKRSKGGKFSWPGRGGGVGDCRRREDNIQTKKQQNKRRWRDGEVIRKHPILPANPSVSHCWARPRIFQKVANS